MQTVAYLNGSLADVEYLCRMIAANKFCRPETHSIIGRSNVFAIKVKRHANICKSVLLSCISFAKVTIIDEDEVLKENDYEPE